MQYEANWGEIPKTHDNPLSYATMLRQSNVLKDVYDAVAQDRVTMAFQPVVTTTDRSQIAFYEGLIRILDRDGRIIPAGDFIDEVEITELGRLIDCLALEIGLDVLKRQPNLRLSINMSARSVGYLKWVRILENALRRSPSIGERLILEITEQSAILVPDLVCGFMNDLQGQGISFALDDFGSGFTSFQYLKNFYFDILKIDGQFIRKISTDTDNQIITRSIVTLADEFGMLSVAEHVENKSDADYLTRAGVSCMQGFHFGAPRLRRDWTDEQDDTLAR